MNSPLIRRTLFLAAIVAASSTFASGNVNKCVDSEGRITLTDEACPSGAVTEVLAAAPVLAAPSGEADALPAQPAPDAARVAHVTRVSLAPAQPRHDSWVRKTAPGRSLAVDVATLKAARLSMRVTDNASAAVRSQRLATLD